MLHITVLAAKVGKRIFFKYYIESTPCPPFYIVERFIAI